MPNDISSKLRAATSALSKANKAFPQSKPPAHVSVPAPDSSESSAPKPKAPSGLGAELQVKADNVNQYANAPKMHNGGPILRDGVYQLKKGEHVLTEPEARKAKKHALMASGMNSLSKVVPVPPSRKGASTPGEPKAVDAKHKMPEKKTTLGIKIRPEKNQSAQIKQQMAQ